MTYGGNPTIYVTRSATPVNQFCCPSRRQPIPIPRAAGYATYINYTVMSNAINQLTVLGKADYAGNAGEAGSYGGGWVTNATPQSFVEAEYRLG